LFRRDAAALEYPFAEIYIRIRISGVTVMRVAKWGNSLAIRLPASVVDALELKAGDQVEVRLAGARTFGIDRDHSRDDALARLREARWTLPPDWKLDRDEANAR
jgi:antitoxin MazE